MPMQLSYKSINRSSFTIYYEFQKSIVDEYIDEYKPKNINEQYLSLSYNHLGSLIATLFSVIGAIIGYWVGNKFGRGWTKKFVSEEKFMKAEKLFTKYGGWAIAIAAISPLPYKVFTITAGIMNYNLKNFIIVSLIARGVRFFFFLQQL